MANAYFRFRQFTIYQDHCAMKVCTDSCIFGAWTASRLRGAGRVLDIGTGTGLLALMLAQKNSCRVDAIELDPQAFEQAAGNFEASTWREQIRPLQADVRYHRFDSKYDFIVSNPPFYESSLHSPSSEKNSARHATTLKLKELLPVLVRLLEEGGAFSVLLPADRTADFEKQAAEKGYFPQEKMLLRQTARHDPFRSLILFAANESVDPVPQELIIRDLAGNETPELLELLGDYYLR